MTTPVPAYFVMGPQVSSSTYSWMDMAIRAWGSEWNAPDHNIYKFSNSRGFDSTDRSRNGIYGVIVVNGIQFDTGKPQQYPDMYYGVILQENGGRVGIDG